MTLTRAPIGVVRAHPLTLKLLADAGEEAVSIARASGIPWDLRKSNPYSCYEDFDFLIPVGQRGDVYDRFLVRIAEMKESCKIIRQALDNLPPGEWSTSDRKIAPPPRHELDSSMESLIHHFKLVT